MKSIEGNFNNPEVNELLNKHFVELRSVSPAGSTHVLDIGGLKDQTIKFWSFWDNNNLIGLATGSDGVQIYEWLGGNSVTPHASINSGYAYDLKIKDNLVFVATREGLEIYKIGI